MALPAVTTSRLGAPSWQPTASPTRAKALAAPLASSPPQLSDKEHVRRGGSGAAGLESPSRAPFHPSVVPRDQDRLLESFLEASSKRDRDRMQTLSDGTLWRVQREEGRASRGTGGQDCGSSLHSASGSAGDSDGPWARHGIKGNGYSDWEGGAGSHWPEWRAAAEAEAERYFPLARAAADRRARGRLRPEQRRRIEAAAAAAVEAPALLSAGGERSGRLPRPSKAPLHALQRRLEEEDAQRARQQLQVRADWDVLRREPPKPRRPLGAFTREQRRAIGEEAFAMAGGSHRGDAPRPQSPLRSRAFASPQIRPPAGAEVNAAGADTGAVRSPSQARPASPARGGGGGGGPGGSSSRSSSSRAATGPGSTGAAMAAMHGGATGRRCVRKRMTAAERENHPFAPNRPFRWRDPAGRGVQLRQWRRAHERERADRDVMRAREDAWRYAEWLKQRGSVRAAAQAGHHRDVARARALARRRRVERRAEAEAEQERARERRGAAVYQQRHGQLAQPRPQDRGSGLCVATVTASGHRGPGPPPGPSAAGGGALLGGSGGEEEEEEDYARDRGDAGGEGGGGARWRKEDAAGEPHPLARLLAVDTPTQSAEGGGSGEGGAATRSPPSPPTLRLPSPPASEGSQGPDGASAGTPGRPASDGSHRSSQATHARPLASLRDSAVAAAVQVEQRQEQQEEGQQGMGQEEQEEQEEQEGESAFVGGRFLADYVRVGSKSGGAGWSSGPLRPRLLPSTADARTRRRTDRPPTASPADSSAAGRSGAAAESQWVSPRPATEHGRRHGSLAAAAGATLARLQVDDPPSLEEAEWLRSADEASLVDFGRQLDSGEPSLGSEALESASRASSATPTASRGAGHVAEAGTASRQHEVRAAATVAREASPTPSSPRTPAE